MGVGAMKASYQEPHDATGRERRLDCKGRDFFWCCLVAQILLFVAPYGHADLPARIYASGWNGMGWSELDGVYELTSSVGGTNDMYRRDGALPMLWLDEDSGTWAVWMLYSAPSAVQEQGNPDPTAWIRWVHLYQEETYYPPPRAFTADLRPRVNPDPSSAETVDPINTINGNVRVSETDVAIPCPGTPLVFRRSYNSRSQAEGAMGKGWRHSYEWSVATTNEVSGLPSHGNPGHVRIGPRVLQRPLGVGSRLGGVPSCRRQWEPSDPASEPHHGSVDGVGGIRNGSRGVQRPIRRRGGRFN